MVLVFVAVEASFELQNGFEAVFVPGRPRAMSFEREPMPTPWAVTALPFAPVPAGGFRILTNASVVSERSLRRQACVRPVLQTAPAPPPVAHDEVNKLPQLEISVLRASLKQSYLPSWVKPK